MNWSDLPELALIKALDYLPVHDHLNVRLVCRNWRLITDSSGRRDELALFYESHPIPVFWFHNGSEVDPGNAYMIIDLEVLKNEFFKCYFRKLRRLVVALEMGTTSRKFLEAIQTSFPQLEHLQFNFLGLKRNFSNLWPLVYEATLQLPNLKTLYSEAGDMPLALNCPRLTDLFVYSELNINEQTDEQTKLCIQNLRFLLVQNLTYSRDFEFSNLEVLYFNKPSPSIVLSDFPRLKELHYFDGASGVHYELPGAWQNLLEQKRNLKRDELRFYFDGFELKKREDFRVLDGYLLNPFLLFTLDLNEKVLRLIKEDSPRCKFNMLRKRLRMSDALDDELVGFSESDELVESMFKSAYEIHFYKPLTRDSLNLFELSYKFRYVTCVNVSVELSQVLLDRLPDALPHLVYFSYHPKFFSDHSLNFEFVARFESLHEIFISSNLLSKNELRSIVNNCKLLDSFSFIRSNRVMVQMYRSVVGLKFINQKVFRTRWFSSDREEFARAEFSKEEMFDYLEKGRWLEKSDFLEGERNEVSPPLFLRPIHEQVILMRRVQE